MLQSGASELPVCPARSWPAESLVDTKLVGDLRAPRSDATIRFSPDVTTCCSAGSCLSVEEGVRAGSSVLCHLVTQLNRLRAACRDSMPSGAWGGLGLDIPRVLRWALASGE